MHITLLLLYHVIIYYIYYILLYIILVYVYIYVFYVFYIYIDNDNVKNQTSRIKEIILLVWVVDRSYEDQDIQKSEAHI